MKKSRAMKRYLRIVEETGCPECKSEDVYETHKDVIHSRKGPRKNVLGFICDECGYSEDCPEQPNDMFLVVAGFGSIRDENGDILPEFLKPKNKKEK